MPSAQEILDIIDKNYNAKRGYLDYYFYNDDTVITEAKAYLQNFINLEEPLPTDAAFQLNNIFRQKLVEIHANYIAQDEQERRNDDDFLRLFHSLSPWHQSAFKILFDSPLFVAWAEMTKALGLLTPMIDWNDLITLTPQQQHERVIDWTVVHWFGILDHFHITFADKSFESIHALGAMKDASLLLNSVPGLLNQANFNLLEAHAHRGMEASIRFMKRAGVLDQDNVEFLLAPEQAILMSESIKKALWERLPQHLCSSALWGRLVNYCQYSENPEQAILEEAHRLLVGASSGAFNGPQSIHVKSVEDSIPKAVKLLKTRYSDKLSDFDDPITKFFNWLFHSSENNVRGTDNILAQMKQFIDSLDNTRRKNVIAKKAFNDLTTNPDLHHYDTHSGISTIQLLALFWLAIHDKKNMACSLEDAKLQLVEGLYEAERAYNLDEKGRDSGIRSLRTCPPGAFDKIVEQLWKIYKGIEIKYMTLVSAAAKLQAMVNEAAFEYVLFMLKNVESLEDFLKFSYIVHQMKTDGIEVVLPDVVNQKSSPQSLSIADKFFEEFEELYYNNREDPSFKATLEAGNSAQLLHLERLQKPTIQSEGYHAYCRSVLLETRGFFGKKLQNIDATYLSEHRHNSREDQEEYDQHFGLVLKQ